MSDNLANYARLRDECALAADVMARRGTFETGQGVLRDACAALDALRAEVERLTQKHQSACLDAIAAYGQAQEAYEAQHAAEAGAAAARDQLWKLREVLERLIALDDLDANPTGSELADAWLDARAALQGEG